MAILSGMKSASKNFREPAIRKAPLTTTGAPQIKGVGAAFFFFQAEDSIRVHCVTGVQTCALPICEAGRVAGATAAGAVERPLVCTQTRAGVRSEERRVGQEGRSRWSAYH